MRPPVPLAAVVLLLVLAAPASAQEQRIAPGTKAGDLDVGGLTEPEAIVKLQQSYNAALGPADLDPGRGPALPADDEEGQARVRRPADRPPRAPPSRAPGCRSPSRGIARWCGSCLQRVARIVYLAPRDATIRITLRHIFRKRSRTGRSLGATKLRTMVARTLANPDPASSRVVRPARKVLRAKVTARELARIYGTVITIDRDNFKLRLFKRLKFSRSYGVAVGQPAYPTPTGRYSIQNKQVNPAWTAPNSPWAGELAGTTTPGGSASNPLRARWMGITGGVGIHGTSQEYSIGSRASHGCIRMRVADVIDLYRRVPIGTPVLIR